MPFECATPAEYAYLLSLDGHCSQLKVVVEVGWQQHREDLCLCPHWNASI